MAGTKAVLTQLMWDKELIVASLSHHLSEADSHRGPTERKCMVLLDSMAHVYQYLAGRLFILVTDRLALT